MKNDLSAPDLQQALAALGKLCRTDTRIVLAGSVSLMLQGLVNRITHDGDVLDSHPDFGGLRQALREVASAQGIPEHWLNDSAKSYAEVLPPDYQARLRHIGPFGRLSVALVSRPDMIVMKFFAGRQIDIGDLQQLAPKPTELEFARAQLSRLRRIDAARAERMEALLDGWPSVSLDAERPPRRPPKRGRSR